ncbi:MAG TPA: TIGR01244 family sulfur transferase [Croceibacterium sp.]|nr:TIGR01244 family sulfur transferase [Croceibacterium sp.]
MSDFRQVTPTFWASPQIGLDDVQEAAARGFALIVNNRPEGESEDQVPGAAIAAAAAELGLGYSAIPVTHAGFSEDQVEAMTAALKEAEGPVLAYCRSGTRSTLLWALAQAAQGREPEVIAAEAAGAGYDVAPIRPMLDMLAARRS